MNHPNAHAIQAMAKLDMPHDMPQQLSKTPFPLTCSACAQGKQARAPRHDKPPANTEPGDHITSDARGPIKPYSTNDNAHFATYADAKTKCNIIRFIKTRSQIQQTTQTALKTISAQKCKTPKLAATDNAKEYLIGRLTRCYEATGIATQQTMPHTPQENGQAERLNRTLREKARASLISSKLPPQCWEHAIADANDKCNHAMRRSTNSIPACNWTRQPIALSTFYPFGQYRHAVALTGHKTKLQHRAYPCKRLQRLDNKRYKALNVTTNAIQHCRAADFHPYNPNTDPTKTANAAFTPTPKNLNKPNNRQIATIGSNHRAPS